LSAVAEDAAAATGVARGFETPAADGFAIRGFEWRHPDVNATRPVVIVNAATSVRCRYYFRFADYLHGNGFDVVLYDYRGIGESRPASLRGFDASWSDWGGLDFEAMLQRVQRDFRGQPILAVGHSYGGAGIGLAPSAGVLQRVLTVGAQFAYWRDYLPRQRLQMVARWHLLMPVLTALWGYFPGQRLGWLEDTPAGVVNDWVYSTERLEDRRSARKASARGQAVMHFDRVRAPILAISTTDDPFATVPATDRLLALYTASDRQHLRIAPVDVDTPAIGHFAFFHRRFEASLWPIALAWLRDGVVPEPFVARVVARHAAGPAG
jgi:predicted alpha/beta hydrolase